MSRKAALALITIFIAVGVGLWRAAAQDEIIPAGDNVDQSDRGGNTDNPADSGGDQGGEDTPDNPTPDPVENDEDPPPSTEDPTDPPPPALDVTRSEPHEITAGQEIMLSVFGSNFTDKTTVRLVGFGLLETSLVNSGAVMATIPTTVPRGNYEIEISDPVNGTDTSPDKLRVKSPPSPTETDEPDPTDTPEPTPIPGQPALVARNFSANPPTVAPGSPVTFTFEVVNQGNRAALGVALALDTSGKFVPANGQAGVTLPDIQPGGVYTVTLSVVAAMDTPSGPASVPIKLTYRDFEGKDYTVSANLSVNVGSMSEASQVILARYLLNPNPVVPGDPVTLTVLVQNTGNKLASQVLLRIAGDKSVLLAGVQGDSFPLGDLAAGASVSLDLPMIVSEDADAGPQAQPITLTYLQEGESKETAGSLTVPVEAVAKPAPLLLLKAYDVGKDTLTPGEQFTLSLTLQNVGDADAEELLVTFGTVASSGGDTGSGDNNDTDNNNNSSNTSTTPSTTFAPIGAGGTLYIGTLTGDGGETTLEQAFIVNGTTDSGVYTLPISLRYVNADGDSVQNDLNASVVVLAPPHLQINLQGALPETANLGEPLSLALQVINVGADKVNLTMAEVTADNGDVLDGASVFIGALESGDDESINATVSPSAEGALTVTLTLHYIDDLNQEGTLTETYQTEAVAPPPVEEPPPDFNAPPPVEEPEQQDMIGQLILGLLGLGK